MDRSRGGNTAALHAIRDSRIDALVDYYGPTDFFNESAQGLATLLLGGDPIARGLPGAQFVFDTILTPLRNADGSANPNADYAAARIEVARRSAALFEGDLPDTQVHHHFRDGTVTVGFSQAFIAAAEGGGGGSFESFLYGTPIQSQADLNGAVHRPNGPEISASIPVVQAFLANRLSIGASARQSALAL